MRLVSITTKNFRTLEDIKLSFAKSYCTISGKNNAGKSSVIRLLSLLFRLREPHPWVEENPKFSHKDDRTQWVKSSTTIDVGYELELTKSDDPSLISFIERIASLPPLKERVSVVIQYNIPDTDDLKVSVKVDGAQVEAKAAKEIDQKIKDSELVFLYNSTTKNAEIYFGGGRRRLLYDFVMSNDDKKQIEVARKSVAAKIRRLAKEHKEGLDTILGRLTDHYDVEFSPLEGFGSGHMPVGINLKDKNVEVPLDDWGSGTQNRTQIMLVILQASRIKGMASADDKITPIVIIEEPESFLHPSAQAEFGRLLRALSEELGVQLIITTHSPYMLNRDNPASNILLSRRLNRGKPYDTIIQETGGEDWMAPFAEHLGIQPKEFLNWKPLFSSYKSKVLLVEGMIDEEYFRFLQKLPNKADAFPPEIDIVSYGGKDTLKNTVLVKFVLSNFDRVFVTYDLDADNEVKDGLHRLGLKESQDFLPLGIPKAGKDCIEGMLPDKVLSIVNGRETDLIMKLGSAERRQAKEKLKKLYLEEFKSRNDYSADELKALTKITRAINHRFQKDN